MDGEVRMDFILPDEIHKDKKKIIVSLVSRQTMPNYIGARILNPEIMVYLFTNQEKTAFEYLIRVLSIPYENHLIDAYDPEGVQKIINDLFQKHASYEILLNLTGGTKIMALSAFNIFRKHSKISFYVNTADNEILWFLTESIKRTPIGECVDIPTYLKLYGQNIYAEDKPKYPKLSEQIGENYAAYRSLLSEFREINLNKEHRIKTPLSQRQRALLTKIGSLGIFRYDLKRHTILVQDTEVLKYLKGDWLEEYVYGVLKQSDCADIRFRVRLEWNDRENTWKNEFDVVAIFKNKLYIFECKSGKLNQNDIHKLESLRELVGGTYGRGFLIYSTFNEKENIPERLKDFKEIDVVPITELKKFVRRFYIN